MNVQIIRQTDKKTHTYRQSNYRDYDRASDQEKEGGRKRERGRGREK